MGAGRQEVNSLPGTFSVDLLRLRSPAPVPLPGDSGGGRVVEAGHLGDSSVDGVRVALDGPSWLVLGESFSEGWRASCNGRDLGQPRPINGYANGWRAPAGCRDVSFSYAPQSSVRAGYLISGGVCALLLGFLAVGWLVLRRRRAAPPEPPRALSEDRPERMPAARAAIYGLVAALPLAFLFSARSFVVIFPLLALILWRPLGSRLLTAVAAVLLGVVVPLMYAAISPRDLGGFNFDYSRDLLAPHWVGVLALVLLMVVCWRALSAARVGRPAPAQTSPPRAGGRSSAA
jgi:hypothetical protein